MTTSTAQFRYIGTTNDVVDCEKCGKADLRCTVIIVPLDADGNDDGEPCYYGSTCAARALNVPGGGKAVRSAADGARLQTLMNAHDARRMLRHYGLPETGEPTAEILTEAAVIYAHNHRNAGWAWEVLAAGWREMTMDMLARKQAAITEAVLVAGAEWGKDRQPLEFGYRSVIKETME